MTQQTRTIDQNQRQRDLEAAEEQLARRQSGSFRSVREAVAWYFDSMPKFTGPVSPTRRTYTATDGTEFVLAVDNQPRWDFVAAMSLRASIQKALEGVPAQLEADARGRGGRAAALSPAQHLEVVQAVHGGLADVAPYGRERHGHGIKDAQGRELACGLGAPWLQGELARRYNVSEATISRALGRVEAALMGVFRSGGIVA